MNRPWTAILSENSQVTAINVSAPYEHDNAKKELEEKFPGRVVVALIPGEHATYTHTYDRLFSRPIGKKDAREYIDPFDTDHFDSIS